MGTRRFLFQYLSLHEAITPRSGISTGHRQAADRHSAANLSVRVS